MITAEILGRLNAKSQDFTGLPPGYGGITPADIAGSMAGLDRGSQLVLMARYCQYPGLERELMYRLWNYAVDVSIEFGWPKPPKGQELLRKLSRLAVLENVYPLPCRRCSGKKRVMRREGYAIICPRCTGGGTHTLNNRERCEITGLTYYQWRQWQSRYKVLSNAINYWDNDGLKHVKNQLQN